MENKNGAQEYTLDEFMAIDLPENSKLIEKKLGNNYIGPFSKRLRRLSATYNVHFPELEPAFRKLDLILASGDKELIDAALRIDDLTIDNLVRSKAVESLLGSAVIDDKDVYLLSNDAGWETTPHEEGGEDRVASGGGTGGGPRAAFTSCHETFERQNKIWIPEFVGVFEQIDKLLMAAG